MTATPRIYGDQAKAKAADRDVLVASMDDPSTFGEVFHELGFGEAVAQKLLSDYKVLVLAVNEGAVSQRRSNANSLPAGKNSASTTSPAWSACGTRSPNGAHNSATCTPRCDGPSRSPTPSKAQWQITEAVPAGRRSGARAALRRQLGARSRAPCRRKDERQGPVRGDRVVGRTPRPGGVSDPVQRPVSHRRGRHPSPRRGGVHAPPQEPRRHRPGSRPGHAPRRRQRTRIRDPPGRGPRRGAPEQALASHESLRRGLAGPPSAALPRRTPRC
jgi:hypothetical protein